MSIDYNTFTPWMSLVGGLLIVLSATIYILGVGRTSRALRESSAVRCRR